MKSNDADVRCREHHADVNEEWMLLDVHFADSIVKVPNTGDGSWRRLKE